MSHLKGSRTFCITFDFGLGLVWVRLSHSLPFFPIDIFQISPYFQDYQVFFHIHNQP